MRRSPRPANGQFTLALHPEPSPQLDEARKDELLEVLAELMVEALGVEPAESGIEREENDELEDHA